MSPKHPGTLEEWRELSRRLRAEADEIDQAIAVLARKSGEAKEEPVEAPSEVMIEAPMISTRLTSDADSTILQNVNASSSSAKLARGMSRSRTKKHPFVKALYEKQRITVTEWAKRHDYKPGTVAAWVAKPDTAGARRIPRDAAEKIEKELGVPATLATWKNGITEPE